MNFQNIKEYNKFISQFNKTTPNQIKAGFLYTYDYDYSEDYDFETLKFFDSSPACLIFTIKDSNHCFGINFHHIPLLTRNWLISRIKNFNPKQFGDGLNPIKINISFTTLKLLMRKSPLAVRQYLNSRMSNIRLIPPNQWSEIVKYQPETFHATNFTDIVDKYKKSA